jgi:hypothetical protein
MSLHGYKITTSRRFGQDVAKLYFQKNYFFGLAGTAGAGAGLAGAGAGAAAGVGLAGAGSAGAAGGTGADFGST